MLNVQGLIHITLRKSKFVKSLKKKKNSIHLKKAWDFPTSRNIRTKLVQKDLRDEEEGNWESLTCIKMTSSCN